MDAPKVKLRRLKILSFRNVVPGCELRFDDGVNVLLGKNGTGKTTLLALISSVVRSDFSAFADEPLHVEFEVGPEPQLIVRIENRAQQSSNESPSLPSAQPGFRLMVELRMTYEGRDLLVEADGVQVRSRHSDKENVDHAPWMPIPNLLLHAMWKLGLVRTVPDWILGLTLVGQAFRFDESLETFRSMLGTPLTSPGPATAPSSALREVNLGWESEYVPISLILGSISGNGDRFERDLIDVPANTAEPASDLREAAQLLGVERVVWIADQPEGQRGRRRFTRFAFTIYQKDGSTLRSEHLSYGQKRLLALLYYMAANPAILIADEIVNGLHHEWIAAVMSRIRDRQAFLTSQNPLLFDYLTIDSAVQAGRMFVVCTSEEDEHGASRVTWRNLDPGEARRFHEDLGAGVEYPSEILLRRGLW